MSDDPLAGLLELIRREAATAATAAVRAELLRARQARETGPRLLSLRDLSREYSIGRPVLQQMIASGELRCTERRCPGGRIGVYVAREDAETVLVGRQVTP